MIKKLKARDIQKGMYVILPDKWFSHPFLKNEFLIESQAQINKIIGARIQEVSIKIRQPRHEKTNAGKEEKNLKKKPDSIQTSELRDIIADQKIPQAKKAKLVHQQSIVMMNRLPADVFDALNSDRPYRNGLGPYAALKLMKKEMLSHFQKDLFKKFVLLFS